MRTIIRAPNHLGDVVMALPALRAADPDGIAVADWLAPLLQLARLRGDIIPIKRGSGGVLDAARRVRRGRYDRGVLLTPSFSSALIMRLGGVRNVVGTDTDRRRFLLADTVDLDAMGHVHRASLYCLLTTGVLPATPPVPDLEVAADWTARWRRFAGGAGPWIGVFPGSNAPSRRWEPDRFATLVRIFADEGQKVVVFGSEAERPITRVVAGNRALDAGGRTDIPMLAAGMADCTLLITNDSGPMHLAAAVGTPVIALFGPGDPVATGPLGEHHQVLRRADLPCVPCVRNECPRHGQGTLIADAHKECLRLIEVSNVMATVRQAIAR